MGLMACSEDEQDPIRMIEATSLDGRWNLIDVTCECAPVDFEPGEHVWLFDLSNRELEVSNTVDEPLQQLATGTYSIELTGNTITIEGVTYDYYFEEMFLYLADQPEVDGPLMKFTRD